MVRAVCAFVDMIWPNITLEIALHMTNMEGSANAKNSEQEKWQSLYRRLPPEVYRDWKEAEKVIAAHFGIALGDKRETPGGWTELYERLAQHILQMTENDLRNF